MKRKGTYTKQVGPLQGTKRFLKKYWLWFRHLKTWQKIAIIVGPILAFLILVPLLTYLYFARDIADQERLMNRNNTGVVLTDHKGEVIYQTGRSKHRSNIVTLGNINDYMEKALIASEDKNFYEHGGFSLMSIFGALYANLATGGHNYGGSTITQQLAKNTLLSEQKTYLRKFQELSISIAIERTYTKDQILEMYLNSVFYGGNVFGIEDAAKTYYNKQPKDLTLAESAMLVGLLPAPNAYSPIYGNKEYAKKQQEAVLGKMVENGVITEQEKSRALAEKITYAKQSGDTELQKAPHFVQMVLNDLYDRFKKDGASGEEVVQRSGYQVKTTLDLTMQDRLQRQVAANMDHIRANQGSNAAAVAIDPRTGSVRALVGSYDWNDPKVGKVNMVTTPRQPGSSFKPLYYADALANGDITPSTIFLDEPINIDGYQPKNATRQYYGNVSVRQALSWSLNIPSVKLVQQLGVERTVENAKYMGITTMGDPGQYGLAVAIGAAEAKLLDITHVYAGFANGGNQKEVSVVEEVKSKFDDLVYKRKDQSKQIISEQGAYLIANILSDDNARAGMFGGALSVPGKKAAVKTGTTDDSRDAWTVGYTPDLAVGVWVGNNDNAIMLDGGSSMAGPIWVGMMSESLPNVYDPFTRPDGIVDRLTCYGTGKLAGGSGEGGYNEVYLATALPDYGCTLKPKEEKKEQAKPPKQEGESDDSTTEKTEETPPTQQDDGDTVDEPDTPDPTPAPETPTPETLAPETPETPETTTP